MDLMATDTSAQYTPIEGGWERQKLPFYSRFHTNSTAGVDVFPRPSSVGVVLAHISKMRS